MAITLAITAGATSLAVGNQTMPYIATVTNGNASSVILNSLVISEGTGSAQISQPNYLTANVPVGVGNPVIAAGASLSVLFKATFTNPTMPGESPDAPGGGSDANKAYYPYSIYQLQGIAQTSDGSVVSASIQVAVSTATTPPTTGGFLDLRLGADLTNFLTL